MNILYKLTNAVPGKEKVGDSNFKDFYPAIHRNMAWGTIYPYIEQATTLFVIPWIGQEYYDALAARYQANQVTDATEVKILNYLQTAIAQYTIYHAMPSLNLVVADMGIQQPSSVEGSSTTANQWSFKTNRWTTLLNGDKFLDNAMAYLETATGPNFQAWIDSDEYDRGRSMFFRLPLQVSEYLNTQSSRRSYAALLPYLKQAEEENLEITIGSAMLTELSSKWDQDNLSVKEKQLLSLVRKYIANQGLLEALPHLAIVIDGDGFRIVSSSDGFDDRRNLTNSNHQQSVERLKYKAQEKAARYHADILSLLYGNPDDFPTWKSSTAYREPTIPASKVIGYKGGIMM